jgi:TolA-binding protein
MGYAGEELDLAVRHRPFIEGRFLCIVLACLFTAGSCAYFNTLYNARRIYREAEERREGGGSERELRERYKEVITKCATVVRDYPSSRWVDDALFLMGKALVRQGDPEKGIRTFTELATNFPKSEYVPPSFYWIALAYYEKADYNLAIVYTNRFIEAYPKHDLRHRVMFLAGDINRKLEKEEEALSLYSLVAEEASHKDVVDEATLKTAELFHSKGEWEKAASAYAKILRKGIPWQRRYDISIALGDCYTLTGRCREALDVIGRLLEESVSSKEKAPLMLGRAGAFVCMDSLQAALSLYDGITKEFPRSAYSAEAYYRMGVIYHEALDSLALAQKAFSQVGGEYANSEYAPIALEKSTSIRRLMELERVTGGRETKEKLAEKRFLAAEIQLTRLGEVELALTNYTAVIDSFAGTRYAPQAAYAIAWIYHYEKGETDRALEMYRRVVSLYPRTQQALGAIGEIGNLGAQELKASLEAYIDSARVDTSIVAQPIDTVGSRPAPADSAAVTREPGGSRAKPDSLAPVPQPVDSLAPVPQPSDTTKSEGQAPDSARADVQPVDSLAPVPQPDDTVRTVREEAG